MPALRRALSDADKTVRDDGLQFRVLCQGIALDFLPLLDNALHDEKVSLTTKLDALKSIVTWAGLAPKEEKVQGTQANQVNIQINL